MTKKLYRRKLKIYITLKQKNNIVSYFVLLDFWFKELNKKTPQKKSNTALVLDFFKKKWGKITSTEKNKKYKFYETWGEKVGFVLRRGKIDR